MDVSSYDFPKPIWHMIPSNVVAIKLVTLVPVIGLGIIGNLLLLNIIARNRALQTPTNLILANMVAADTITLLFCPIMFICRDFFQNYVLGAIGCNMEGYLQGNFLMDLPTVKHHILGRQPISFCGCFSASERRKIVKCKMITRILFPLLFFLSLFLFFFLFYIF